MSSGAQNMKNAPGALRTAKNVFGSAKLGNGTQRPRYHRERIWESKT
jgi:hypothetical protein